MGTIVDTFKDISTMVPVHVVRKMAANTAKVRHAVRPHIPMIRFPLRGCPAQIDSTTSIATLQAPAPNIVEASKPAPAQIATPAVPTEQFLPTYQKPFGYTARGSGIETSQLPSRLRRKVIEQEEINYILRGG